MRLGSGFVYRRAQFDSADGLQEAHLGYAQANRRPHEPACAAFNETAKREHVMPQTSDEMRELMSLLFGGSGIDDSAPVKFLLSRGYVLTHSWLWRLPNADHNITEKERLCLRFLIEEWDYGGLEAEEA